MTSVEGRRHKSNLKLILFLSTRGECFVAVYPAVYISNVTPAPRYQLVNESTNIPNW